VIKDFNLSIPWTAIKSRNVSVTLDTLEFIIEPRDLQKKEESDVLMSGRIQRSFFSVVF